MIEAIFKAGIRLPDEVQKQIYDNDIPIVKPDFFYKDPGSKGICVFVDGPDHERESIRLDDKKKRRWLKANGYRTIIFSYKNASSFDVELKDLKFKVNCVNPGYTATDFNKFKGKKPVAQGAAVIVKYALLDEKGPSGKYFSEEGETPW